MASFSIGGTTRERVEIEVQDYERSPIGNYHDDNWLRVRVSVSVGAFSGEYLATFLTDELRSFRMQVEDLYRTLEGTAKFSTLEEQLSLRLYGNGQGSILVQGDAVDVPGDGNKLSFELNVDQSFLLSTLQELQNVTNLFPVRSG